jgi:DNA-binding transcriptional MerR regulator
VHSEAIHNQVTSQTHPEATQVHTHVQPAIITRAAEVRANQPEFDHNHLGELDRLNVIITNLNFELRQTKTQLEELESKPVKEGEVKYIRDDTEINTLRAEIRELNHDISTMRVESANKDDAYKVMSQMQDTGHHSRDELEMLRNECVMLKNALACHPDQSEIERLRENNRELGEINEMLECEMQKNPNYAGFFEELNERRVLDQSVRVNSFGQHHEMNVESQGTPDHTFVGSKDFQVSNLRTAEPKSHLIQSQNQETQEYATNKFRSFQDLYGENITSHLRDAYLSIILLRDEEI